MVTEISGNAASGFFLFRPNRVSVMTKQFISLIGFQHVKSNAIADGLIFSTSRCEKGLARRMRCQPGARGVASETGGEIVDDPQKTILMICAKFGGYRCFRKPRTAIFILAVGTALLVAICGMQIGLLRF